MNTNTDTTGPWLTVPEIARRLTPDLELGTALYGPGTGLEAGAFTFNPQPFTRAAKQPEVTAQQVQDLVDETGIEKRPIGDPAYPRGYVYDYAAVRRELGLSAQAPTAARRVEDHPDPDARPKDISTVYRAALMANITEDTVKALIAADAVKDYSEPLRMQNNVTGEFEDVTTGRPAVSVAEVRAAAKNVLGR